MLAYTRGRPECYTEMPESESENFGKEASVAQIQRLTQRGQEEEKQRNVSGGAALEEFEDCGNDFANLNRAEKGFGGGAGGQGNSS